MSLKKFNSFIAKKKFEIECPICLEDLQKGEKIVMTYCCNNLLHSDYNPKDKCPCCRGEHFIKEKPVIKTVVEKVYVPSKHKYNPNDIIPSSVVLTQEAVFNPMESTGSSWFAPLDWNPNPDRNRN